MPAIYFTILWKTENWIAVSTCHQFSFFVGYVLLILISNLIKGYTPTEEHLFGFLFANLPNSLCGDLCGQSHFGFGF